MQIIFGAQAKWGNDAGAAAGQHLGHVEINESLWESHPSEGEQEEVKSDRIICFRFVFEECVEGPEALMRPSQSR